MNGDEGSSPSSVRIVARPYGLAKKKLVNILNFNPLELLLPFGGQFPAREIGCQTVGVSFHPRNLNFKKDE